jgi:hypothetical protein
VDARLASVALALILLSASGCAPTAPTNGEGADPNDCQAGDVVSAAPGQKRFVPPTYREHDRVVMPVVFPDGSTAELVYPPSLNLASLGLSAAQIWGRLSGNAGSDRDLWITYGPVDAENVSGDHPIECYRGVHGQVEVWRSGPDWRSEVPELVYVPLGAWTARIEEGYGGDFLTKSEREQWASSLGLEETASGWPVLRESPDTALGAEHWGHVELMMGNLEPGILLFPVECEEGGISEDVHGDWFANLCFADGPMTVHVYGGDNEDFVRTAAGELRVRNVHLAFPADRYHIVP